jgi:hypothetical protein
MLQCRVELVVGHGSLQGCWLMFCGMCNVAPPFMYNRNSMIAPTFGDYYFACGEALEGGGVNWLLYDIILYL